MHHHNYPLEEIDGFEIESPAVDTGENFEAITEDTVFNETDEMELAEQLLEIADERELDRLLGTLIARAMGEAPRLAPLRPLRGILRNAAMCALPAICGPGKNIPMASRNGSDAGRVADMAGSLLGLEFEGGGGENREFEVARHFVRFAGTSARNVPHFHAAAPPEIAARRALVPRCCRSFTNPRGAPAKGC